LRSPLVNLKALVLALFAYMGTELIGVTVGEAKNPRKTVPSAIKKTFVCHLCLYDLAVCQNGVADQPNPIESVAYLVLLHHRSAHHRNDRGLQVSPPGPGRCAGNCRRSQCFSLRRCQYVIDRNDKRSRIFNSCFLFSIVTSAGIKGLPSVINACILIFTFSAANSDQYIASRTLYGMARDGHAPMIFARCTKRGVPYVSFIFTGCFMGLAYLVASSGE
jgi:amino acid transporter